MSEAVAVWIVLPFALVAGTIVHEGGHWAMAAALRCDPRVVCLGTGRQLWQLRALGVHLVLRAVPFGGHVMLGPMGRDRRNAYAAVAAAGAAANLLALLAVLLIGRLDAIPPATVFLVAGGQAVALAQTLLPGFDRPAAMRRTKVCSRSLPRREQTFRKRPAHVVERPVCSAPTPAVCKALYFARKETFIDGLRCSAVSFHRYDPHHDPRTTPRLRRRRRPSACYASG